MKALTARLALIAAVALLGCTLTGCSPGSSSFEGDWGSSATGQPSLSIGSDGTFTGTDGCNPVNGKGTISGNTFTFGPFASIQLACEGVTPWLNLASTATVDGNTLTVFRNSGDSIGSLEGR